LKIQAENKWDESFDLFFDSNTYRFAGLARTNPDSNDDTALQIVYMEWRTVDEITLPNAIVITDKAGEYIYKFRVPSINTIDENIFTVPDKIKSSK